MDQGIEIGQLARSLYSHGTLIEERDSAEATAVTQRLMADPGQQVIFEATFLIDGYVAKADLLVRNGDGWDVVEVKMNLEDTSQIEDLIDDLTYTTMIASRSGVQVRRSLLMLLSRQYRNPPCYFILTEVDARGVWRQWSGGGEIGFGAVDTPEHRDRWDKVEGLVQRL